MKGKGSITDIATGETHEIKPGVVYALNLHDKHILRAEEELHMACCFNPPVTGHEVHQADGSYAAPSDLETAG
jgi:L-ectoine synthase